MVQESFDVLLIGGSGFFAQHLIENFLNQDQRILVLGRTPPPKLHDLEWRALDLASPIPPNLPKIRAQVCLFNSSLKARFDAGSPQWNMQGRIGAPNFGQLFSQLNADVDRLISIGSSEEYGPVTEADWVDEETPARPASSYGFWKLRLLENARAWGRSTGRPTVHLRPFVVYGKNQDPTMFLGSLIETLKRGENFKMTKGEQWRSFVNISTIVSLVDELHNQKSWPVDLLNVSSPHNYRQIVDVAKFVKKLIGRGSLEIGAIPYRETEVWHQRPRLERLEKYFPKLRHSQLEEDLQNLVAN